MTPRRSPDGRLPGMTCCRWIRVRPSTMKDWPRCCSRPEGDGRISRRRWATGRFGAAAATSPRAGTANSAALLTTPSERAEKPMIPTQNERLEFLGGPPAGAHYFGAQYLADGEINALWPFPDRGAGSRPV